MDEYFHHPYSFSFNHSKPKRLIIQMVYLCTVLKGPAIAVQT